MATATPPPQLAQPPHSRQPADPGKAAAPAVQQWAGSSAAGGHLVDGGQLLEGGGHVVYLSVLPLQPPRHLLVPCQRPQVAAAATAGHAVQRVCGGHPRDRRHPLLPRPLVQPLVNCGGGRREGGACSGVGPRARVGGSRCAAQAAGQDGSHAAQQQASKNGAKAAAPSSLINSNRGAAHTLGSAHSSATCRSCRPACGLSRPPRLQAGRQVLNGGRRRGGVMAAGAGSAAHSRYWLSKVALQDTLAPTSYSCRKAAARRGLPRNLGGRGA